jgi:5-(carboxyamino)imidazole ribonucleotide synthase
MRVGILGDGQLAMMLAQASKHINVETLCFSSQQNSPASHESEIFTGDINSQDDLKRFAQSVDVITFENEFIDAATIAFLKQYTAVYPDANALAITQDRIAEKKLFNALDIPCADFFEIDNVRQLENAIEKFKYSAILKTRRLGYDGKGQCNIKDKNSMPSASAMLNDTKGDLILEKKVAFDCEVSIIAARNSKGDCVYYPLAHNTHVNGILRESTAPYTQDDLQVKAQAYAQKIIEHFNYVGVIAIEFFVVGNELFANEIAPRVHNSGHWSIEASNTSQFENHLRAVTNIPLGDTSTSPVTMTNIIGTFPAGTSKANNTVIHDYHKSERPNRKLGHITSCDNIRS